jgi:NADPH-dependent 2,4-dienoyl-CoA reductase/sulfur reductase-like enzyme
MPHVIPKTSTPRKVLVVGAGPAGVEAARVASERGHSVVVLEAASKPGGQIRLTAQSHRRREMISIIDWRVARCEEQGVRFIYNTLADSTRVLAEQADVVIIATGGLPHTEVLSSGNELVDSTWDLISGAIKPGKNVLLFDDAGDHAALQAAEVIGASGAHLEVMTPDRSFAPEVMAMNLVPYMRSLQKLDVTFTVTYRLLSVERAANGLIAHVGSDYGGVHQQRLVDQVIINHGTRPLDELYLDLKADARNGGAVDYDALLAGRPQPHSTSVGQGYQLFRIGDAVSARNTHAAIYDALRLVKDL